MLAPSPSYGPPWGRFGFWFVISAFLLVTINGMGLLYVLSVPLPPLVMALFGIGGGILAAATGAIGFALYFDRPRLVRWIVALTTLALVSASVLAISYVRMVVDLNQAFSSFPF